jgi:hypothetical protein
MANVIPREGLSKMQKRNSAHFLLIGSLMLSAGAIVAILAILPAYVSVRIAHAAVDSSQRAAEENLSTDQAAALRTQGLLKHLAAVASATTSPTEALTTALSQKPAGVSITVVSYTASSKSMLLTGTSQRREAVTAFRDALEGSRRFTTVAVPVAALVGTQEGRFTVTLNGI